VLLSVSTLIAIAPLVQIEPLLMTTATPLLQFLAGHPALDFTNTLHGRLTSERYEHLETYSALVAWAHLAGLFGAGAASSLARMQRNDPRGARGVLARATRAREALYAVVSAVAAGRLVPPEPLQALNREVAAAGGLLRLTPQHSGRGFRWEVREPLDLAAPLRAVTWAAAELLASDALGRVRECEAPTCSWLFLDGTRNHSRRWCDTAACGNRERVRRHYRRHAVGRGRSG
jgi:predicted RNA-binding Zn ribbon-like protein